MRKYTVSLHCITSALSRFKRKDMLEPDFIYKLCLRRSDEIVFFFVYFFSANHVINSFLRREEYFFQVSHVKREIGISVLERISTKLNIWATGKQFLYVTFKIQTIRKMKIQRQKWDFPDFSFFVVNII